MVYNLLELTFFTQHNSLEIHQFVILKGSWGWGHKEVGMVIKGQSEGFLRQKNSFVS